MLKGVVIVVIPLSKRKDGHEPAVAGTRSRIIGAIAHRMAQRIDEKGAVLHTNQTCHAGEKKCPESTLPAVVEESENGRKDHSEEETDNLVMLVLPHHEGIFFEICDIGERAGIEFEEDPAHVSPEKSASDAVGIIIYVIYILVVFPVVRGPVEGRIFKGAGTKEQRCELYRFGRFKCFVGKEAVITERNAHAGGDEVENEKTHLKGIQSEVIDVERCPDEGGEEGDDQKDARNPVDAIKRYFRNHIV